MSHVLVVVGKSTKNVVENNITASGQWTASFIKYIDISDLEESV